MGNLRGTRRSARREQGTLPRKGGGEGWGLQHSPLTVEGRIEGYGRFFRGLGPNRARRIFVAGGLIFAGAALVSVLKSML